MKLFSLAAAAVTATGLFFATPAVSKADHPHRPSVGLSIGVGDFRFSYGSGYSGYAPLYPRHVAPTYVVPGYRYADDCDYRVLPRASFYHDTYRPGYAGHDHHRRHDHHGHHGHHHRR